ncbi:MAG: PadR family transcriptional regulator [Actinomycetota bacterium]|nr:PadR family transcriptional regulator [Actinomycetota bacterium]
MHFEGPSDEGHRRHMHEEHHEGPRHGRGRHEEHHGGPGPFGGPRARMMGGWGGPPFGGGFFAQGPFGPGERGRRGPRAGRGDVRYAILQLLSETPRHGYDLIQELATRSNGAWQPSPGSVYPTLQALEDEGLISPEVVEGKKVFSLTEAGRGYLQANPRSSAPWDDIATRVEDGFEEIRKAAGAVVAAVMQGVQSGTQTQRAAILELLNSTKRSIYKILSED